MPNDNDTIPFAAFSAEAFSAEVISRLARMEEILSHRKADQERLEEAVEEQQRALLRMGESLTAAVTAIHTQMARETERANAEMGKLRDETLRLERAAGTMVNTEKDRITALSARVSFIQSFGGAVVGAMLSVLVAIAIKLLTH